MTIDHSQNQSLRPDTKFHQNRMIYSLHTEKTF